MDEVSNSDVKELANFDRVIITDYPDIINFYRIISFWINLVFYRQTPPIAGGVLLCFASS